jgi:hypothetical protein
MTTRACYCNNCKGNQLLSENRIRSHKRAYGMTPKSPGIAPRQSTDNKLVDTVTNEIWRLSLEGATSSPSSKRGEAFWEREADSQPISESEKSIPPTSMGSFATEMDPAQEVYESLVLLDFDLHERKAKVAEMKVKGTLDDADHQEAWFLATLQTLEKTDSSGSNATEYLKTAMMEVASDEIRGLREWTAEKGRATLVAPSSRFPKECVVDTGALFYLPVTLLM